LYKIFKIFFFLSFFSEFLREKTHSSHHNIRPSLTPSRTEKRADSASQQTIAVQRRWADDQCTDDTTVRWKVINLECEILESRRIYSWISLGGWTWLLGMLCHKRIKIKLFEILVFDIWFYDGQFICKVCQMSNEISHWKPYFRISKELYSKLWGIHAQHLRKYFNMARKPQNFPLSACLFDRNTREQGKCRLTNECLFFLFFIGRWYYEKNILSL